MRYNLKVIPKAGKDFDELEIRDRDFVKKKIVLLGENPRPFGCQKLADDEGYRIRAGNFRILYRIDDHAKEVIIYRVKHRREAYR